MKYVIFGILLSAIGASAQEMPLFKVITFSDNVTIDGAAVVINTDVTAASKEIAIPKKGYLGVITTDGLAYELQNSIAVADVNSFVKDAQPIPTGARHRPYPMPLYQVLYSSSYFLLTDSVFLSWEEYAEKDRLSRIEYAIKISDPEDHDLGTKSVNHNWVVLNMAPYFEYSTAVAIEVRSLRTNSTTIYGVRMKSDDKKLRSDLERISVNDLALLAAIFELNNYTYDRNFLIYKIMMSRSYKPSGLLITYVGRLQSQLDLK